VNEKSSVFGQQPAVLNSGGVPQLTGENREKRGGRHWGQFSGGQKTGHGLGGKRPMKGWEKEDKWVVSFKVGGGL